MRRAGRLFRIVRHLRARRLTTARQWGAWLRVSGCTIRRDIQDLGFDVPAIMFTFDEVKALLLRLPIVETWGGPALAADSPSALSKVTLALPEARRLEPGYLDLTGRVTTCGFAMRQPSHEPPA